MGDLLLHTTYLCTIGLSLYMSCWLLFKAEHNAITNALAACQILVIIWCIPQLFVGAAATVGMKYLAYGVSYVGISFIGPAWLEFSFRYCGKRFGWRVRMLLFGVSALNYSMFLCNHSYHLFYTEFAVDQVVYGPVFYFHMLYTYVCVFGGMFVVLREFVHKRVAAVHLVLILFTAAVPLGFNLLYISGAVRSSFDLTPPAFALSSLLMLLAVFRYDFLNVNVMAFGQIFASIAEGVIVYNRQGKLTYCNNAAMQWLGISQEQNFSDVRDRLELCGVDARLDYDGQDGAGGQDSAGRQDGKEFPAVTLSDGTRLRIRQYIHRNRDGRMLAGTFVLTDVSEYFELLRQSRELETYRMSLALEQERNRIAQEVHDTTGHTLTMVQSLMRLLRTDLRKQEQADASACEYIDQVQALVSDGIRELRCSINQLRQEQKPMSVTEGVRRLAGSVREIEVEVEILGEDGARYTGLSPVVYSCLREAITNCLKYARASHMDVIVKLEQETLSLYIFDDGQGCADIQEGNGIRGIRERAALAGGTVRIMTGEGGGFQIYLELPVTADE